jgi:hypothetical protein
LLFSWTTILLREEQRTGEGARAPGARAEEGRERRKREGEDGGRCIEEMRQEKAERGKARREGDALREYDGEKGTGNEMRLTREAESKCGKGRAPCK